MFFVRGFISRAKGGHSACLVLFSYFYIVRVGSDHLCCFPRWLPVDHPYFALCPSICQVSRCSSERSWQAGQCHFSDRFVLGRASCMVVMITKSHKAISMVGASACAALKHIARGQILHPFFPCYGVSNRFCKRVLELRNVPVMEGWFYMAKTFVLEVGKILPSWTASLSAPPPALKILVCSWNLACTFKGRFYRRAEGSIPSNTFAYFESWGSNLAWKWFSHIGRPVPWWRWTCQNVVHALLFCQDYQVCQLRLLFPSVYAFLWGLLNSLTPFAATGTLTGQQLICLLFPFSAEH